MKKLIYTLLILPILAFAQEEDPCYSINDYNLLTELNNPQIAINLVSGWNMIGYPCTQEVIVSDAFSSIVDEITIVKDNNGNVYMPEFSFNGIGFLEGGQGYQIKMTDFILGFTFCQSIQFPTIEGCTDCEAVNFSKLATTDDGSCSYDSDGDGIVDSLEVVGCQYATACNYDESATDEGECNYEEIGFDCNGIFSPEIGDFIEGGIVFYVDSSGNQGLVAAEEDLYEGLNEPYDCCFTGYEWGCYQQTVNGADELVIGSGYQNTLDIVNQGCITENGGITAAQAALNYESEGYNDWYLPSLNEFELMANTIGQFGDNIGQFVSSESESPYYWTSSEYNGLHNGVTTYNNWFAWVFYAESQPNYNHKSVSTSRVRVIRSFGYTLGCMDETACNYNSEANMADGSCEYPEFGYDCNGNIDTDNYSAEALLNSGISFSEVVSVGYFPQSISVTKTTISGCNNGSPNNSSWDTPLDIGNECPDIYFIVNYVGGDEFTSSYFADWCSGEAVINSDYDIGGSLNEDITITLIDNDYSGYDTYANLAINFWDAIVSGNYIEEPTTLTSSWSAYGNSCPQIQFDFTINW